MKTFGEEFNKHILNEAKKVSYNSPYAQNAYADYITGFTDWLGDVESSRNQEYQDYLKDLNITDGDAQELSYTIDNKIEREEFINLINNLMEDPEIDKSIKLFIDSTINDKTVTDLARDYKVARDKASTLYTLGRRKLRSLLRSQGYIGTDFSESLNSDKLDECDTI